MKDKKLLDLTITEAMLLMLWVTIGIMAGFGLLYLVVWLFA